MIIGIGESVLDIVFRDDQPQHAVPGGSTLNAIVSLGTAGASAAMLTEIGDDHVGDLTMAYLQQHGVDTSFVVRHAGMRSHLSLAFLDEQSDAHYTFYKDHRDFGRVAEEQLPRLTAQDAVLLGSYYAISAQTNRRVEALLEAAREGGALVYYDLNFRQPHAAERDQLMPVIRSRMAAATVVRGSEDDCRILFDETDGNSLYRHHIGPSIINCPGATINHLFIYTRAAGDTEVYIPRPTADDPMAYERRLYPVTPIRAVSTIGAGDNFNAGWLYGWQLGLGLDEQIAMAHRFAADVCMQYSNSISLDFKSQLRQK